MYDQRTRDLDWQQLILAQAAEDGYEEGMERGIKQGIEKGIEQGIEQGIYQVALTMLKQGFEIPTLVSATGLSEIELDRILKENLV